MSQIIKVKHSVTGDIRRVSSPSWDLSSLHNTLVELFGADLPTPYSLSYTDSDGDVVSITSQSELREALQSVGRGGILNLAVGPAGTRPSFSFHTTSTTTTTPPPSRPAPFGISSFFSPTNTSSSSSSPYGSPYSFSTSSSSSSPHSIRTLPLDASVTASQAHDTLFIDEYAPPSFVADFRRLLELGYGWEQTRDILIDFGGDLSKATQALRSSPRRMSVATSRPYFSVSLARMARDLQSAGFALKDAVASLIRNGGVVSNAALELASLNTEERCPNNHVLEVSSYNVGQYETSWYCNRCSQRNRVGQRWFCQKCSYDVCFNCKPAPLPAVLPSPPVSTAPPIISDMSLPPALLEPVRMLEAMGFTDRMRVIEALVSNSGDLVKCATLLAEERRKEEEKEAQIRRQQERIRRQQEQRQAREEAARRAAEQRAEAERRRKEEQLQRELEAKRSDAAKIVVATPEKIGADLAYLVELGFDTVSSTTSLFNAGGDVAIALEELLRLQKQ